MTPAAAPRRIASELSDEERDRWIGLRRRNPEAEDALSGISPASLLAPGYDGPLDLPSDPDAIHEQVKEDAEADHDAPGAPNDVDVGGSMLLHFSDVSARRVRRRSSVRPRTGPWHAFPA